MTVALLITVISATPLYETLREITDMDTNEFMSDNSVVNVHLCNMLNGYSKINICEVNRTPGGSGIK